MEEKDLEFSLEDILREFGSGETPAEEVPAETSAAAEAPEEEEVLRIFPDPQGKKQEPEVNQKPTQRFAPVTEENQRPTQRFTPITEETVQAMEGETVRLDTAAVSAAVEKPTGDTQVFQPVTEEQAAQAAQEAAPVAKVPEGAEPFSQNWEPQYEEPMGEYVPPEPIVFRPRSRLSELKKKLVAGPERRYYALAEEGLGKYQIALFLGSLVVILAVAAVALYQMGLVQENRMRLLVFGEMFAMLLAALLGANRLLNGFISIFKGKFNLDSLLLVTFGVCITDCVFCLREIRVPYCAAFCLEMLMAVWAELERRNTEMGMMDTMRKAVRLNRVGKAPGCYEGRPGFFVADGEVEDFMDSYNQPSAPEKTMRVYALIALLASGGIGLLAGLRGGVSEGFRVWSAAILAAVPATAFICQSRPMAVLERRMHKLGVVLCGWKGVRSACGSGVVPLTDADLFPGGSIKVNGVKFYSQRDPDQTVSYTAALMEASGMGIAGLFTQLRDSRYARRLEADTFRYYENGGIGGEVCGEPVLVGSLSFMQEMGVDLPQGARVEQAVYAAVDGELCGVFAMAFGKLKGVSAGLGTLCGKRNLTPVLVTGNFLLSESFIRMKFNANTRRFAFPTLAERQQIAQWQPDPEQTVPVALTTQEGLAGTAFAITGARALRSAVNTGTWVHMLGGIVGMAIVLLLQFVEGGAALLTPVNLLLLTLVWAIPGLLITEWTRKL